MPEMTPTRRAALELVARGALSYSIALGSWEPDEGIRLPAFTWLDEHGLIAPDYGAPAATGMLQRVPVRLTDAGRALLEDETDAR